MMAWNDDQDIANEGGLAGDFRSQRPRFISPMTWSLPLMRVGDVAVRVHAIFLLLIAVELLRSSVASAPRTLALPMTALTLAFLFALSLLHEAARTFAYRRIGGDLDEWLLWPLGGLCNADVGDQPHRLTWCALVGWLAQCLLACVVGAALWQQTGLLVNGAIPLPWTLEGFREISIGGAGLGVEALWLLQWCNLVSLLVQLLPAFPLTGGRVLMVQLQKRGTWSFAAHRTARSGVVCAVALLIAGIVFDRWSLTALALVVWIASRETLLRVQSSDEFLEPAPSESKRVQRQPVSDQAEIDAILEKINRNGIKSLSIRERFKLSAATRRRRDNGGSSR